jgi:hypothetical protein
MKPLGYPLGYIDSKRLDFRMKSQATGMSRLERAINISKWISKWFHAPSKGFV